MQEPLLEAAGPGQQLVLLSKSGRWGSVPAQIGSARSGRGLSTFLAYISESEPGSRAPDKGQAPGQVMLRFQGR